MQKKKIIILLLLIVVVLLLTALLNSKKSKAIPKVTETIVEQSANTAEPETGKYETQIKSEEGIEISVEPIKILEGGNNVFNVTMNNHVIDLDYDFAKISSLTDDTGQIYNALEWQGPRGGHHLEGVLVFSEIKKDVKSLELKIEGIADADRIFKWEIK